MTENLGKSLGLLLMVSVYTHQLWSCWDVASVDWNFYIILKCHGMQNKSQ